MWRYVNRVTGGFFQHVGRSEVTVHYAPRHPEKVACQHLVFYMLEPNGVTRLDATDLYAALDEADTLVDPLPVED